jgi:hypothetical protein
LRALINHSPVASARRAAEAFCDGNPRSDCVAIRTNAIKIELDARNWQSMQARIDADYCAREARGK